MNPRAAILSHWRSSSSFQMCRRYFHQSFAFFGNDISNTPHNDFLTTGVDYGKNLLDEAFRKHPLNPRDVPPQKPGEDLAPIPVPNDVRSHNQKHRSSPNAIPGRSTETPHSQGITRDVPSKSPTMNVAKKPVIPINPARSAEIQQQASLNDDKKYKCHLCGKQFRVLLALKNHMAIRHDGAEVQLSNESPPQSPTASSIDVSQSKQPSSRPTLSLKRVENDSPESTSEERSSVRSSLLELFDDLGKEKFGREKYKHCRIYTESEIRILAENSKNRSEGIRTFQESGARHSMPVDPKPISCSVPAVDATTSSQTVHEPRNDSSLSAPSGTFNPFEFLASDDGTIPAVFDKSAETPTAASSSEKGRELKDKNKVEIMVDGEKKYQCTICGKAFKTQAGLTGHFENKHPGQATGTTSGSTTDGSNYAIPVNLEDIPAYVPTPVDMSKFPGQEAGEVDPKAAALAEELRNTTVSLEQDVVVHARACTNITVSGVVVEMQSGYQGLIPVLQFSLLLESNEETPLHWDGDASKETERTVDPAETITIRVYGSSLVKRAQSSIREGNLVLVVGLLKLNPVPLGNRSYNNPFVTVSDGGGTVIALV